MPGRVLPRSFYARDPVSVARELLGCWLELDGKRGRISEVEAYLGEGDEAAHGARPMTPRTKVLFGQPGHAYVYLCYGVHHLLNVTTEPAGKAGCVLIRAADGLGGGPGKLTKALGVDLRYYGSDLTKGPLVIRKGALPVEQVLATPRIGIHQSVDLPLRFVLKR
jgi:DNA-3-methyladenine glycosylase